MTDLQAVDPISGPVVCQFFGIFDGISKDQYGRIVAKAPFDKCNLLILAFVHAVQNDKGEYVAQFTNGRDNGFPYDPKDSDADRVNLIVQTARNKNPGIRILLSLGYDGNEVGNAASTPVPFADSVRALAETYGLNGLDIDFEFPDSIHSSALLTLAQQLRTSLNAAKPKRPVVLTITPAQKEGLDAKALQAFDYTMPQSYGNNPSYADQYAKILNNSYSQIVYGVSTEGPIGQTNDPADYVAAAKKAAGFFGWRLDNDSLSPPPAPFPTFTNAIKMWQLMHAADADFRAPIAS
jgi:hypothetical protein